MFQFIILVIFFFFSSLVASGDALKFTDSEQKFIAKKSIITYVYDPEWAPFEWENGIGEHAGIIADILKIISKKSGLNLQSVSSSSWSEAIKKLNNNEVVMVSGLIKNSTNKEQFNFTKKSLFSVPYVFVTRRDDHFSDGFASLRNKKLAFVKNYAIKEYLLSDEPTIKFQTVSNLEEGFFKLFEKKIDVLLVNQASAEYEIQKHAYKKLKISYKTQYKLPVRIAINKEYEEVLVSILDKTIASISKETIHNIYTQHMDASNGELVAHLTQEEKIWISKHPSIRFVGDPHWLPFEAFNDKGEYIGIVAEYLKEIEKITGIKFHEVQTQTWSESVKLIHESRVDMISETSESEMHSSLNFTDSYIQNDIVIVMQNDTTYIDEISTIKDKKIALIKEYGYVSKIKNRYKNINFLEVENIHKGLEALQRGEIDALLCTMALASYHIMKDQYINIRIVGKTEFSTHLSFAIRADLKPLVGIINKAITIIENGKKQEILHKWTMPAYVEKVDYTLAWKILFVAVLFLGFFLYWNTRMKKEIARRIAFEKQQQKMLVQQAKMAAMGEMIDAIAHQWKQPLNAISMLSELAEMDFKEKIVDKQYMKEYKEQISAQVSHLLSTLNEFRNFFRPNEIISTFDAKKALESILLLVKDEFLKHTIEVVIEEENSLTLKGVENEFKHIILNIINNAKDAFSENNIKNKKITIRLYLRDGVKCIEIQDNAGGIPKSIIKDIFKANVTTKAEGKGTGIGLYMSDQIAKKMHAKLSVTNTDDGAIFLLEI